MLFALGNRTRIDISANHDRNPVYVQLADGHVRNSYTVNLRNMENRPREMIIGMTALEGGVIWSNEGSREGAGQRLTTTVSADSVARLRVYVAAPGTGPEREDFALTVTAADDPEARDIDEVFFERPETN